jgi:hypothetical protein
MLVFAASATCVFIPGTSAAFSVGSLAGSYGCVGKTGGLEGGSGTIAGISELMRLNFNGAGGVNGTIVLSFFGEVCNISTSGTYSVKPSGLGLLNLTWNSAAPDNDGDYPCAELPNISITQHTALVVESGGSAFDLQSADDFVTTPVSPTPDSVSPLSDLTNPFVGSCKKQ